MGKRERFLSLPGERNLIELLGEAARQNVRLRELDTAIASSVADEDSEVRQGNLHVKMLLMAGRLREAFDEAKGLKSLGWSYGKVGVVFACILSVLTHNSSKAVTIGAMLEEYAGTSDFYWDDDGGAKKRDVYREVLMGLKSVKIDESEVPEYWEWAYKIGRARIEAIVSGQHRNAYDRAARVLGALSEYYALANDKDKARSLMHEFVFVKFPRHNAFRREVKVVASCSTLVQDLLPI
jgi:hypothetical protein